jgi:hypothetical protein
MSRNRLLVPGRRYIALTPGATKDFPGIDLINAIQWPAMLVTVVAAWMVASQRKFKRNWGFWLFLLSNVLWIIWGLRDGAYALIILQVCLAFLNIRGAVKNR